MRAKDGTIRIAWLRDGEHRRLVALLLATSAFVALAIGLFLMTRRAAGALSIPLPIPQLLVTAACVCAWAIALKQFARGSRFNYALPVAVLLLFAVACSYPGTRAADWFAWSGALAAFVLSARIHDIVTIAKLQHDPGYPGERAFPTHGAISHSEDSEQVLQQLTRVRTEEGHDAIRGTLIGEFAPGERQVTLYVAFCPPFERLPNVDVSIADDSDATVKLAQFLHNGAQLEVRLSQPAAESTQVELEFFATDAESS